MMASDNAREMIRHVTDEGRMIMNRVNMRLIHIDQIHVNDLITIFIVFHSLNRL